MKTKTVHKTASFQNLFWNLSGVFFIILLLIGVAFIYITIHNSDEYFDEVNELLNHNVAAQIVKDVAPFKNGKPDHEVLEKMFSHAMAVNPGLEIYLLDTSGKIIDHSLPKEEIVLNSVDLSPVKEFISNENIKFIKGNNPRNTKNPQIFSASSIISNGSLQGYIYIVIDSNEYNKITAALSQNYLLQISSKAIVLILLGALFSGLIVFRYLTRNQRKIVEVMQRFKQGDLNARIEIQSSGDTKVLAESFNEMADVFTQNLDKVNTVEVLRRELIANISHDLRTPVSVIQGFAETLQMKEKTLSAEDRKRYTNTIVENTQRLEKLVNELFELSKLEAKQVEPKMEAFSINELLNDLYNKYLLMAKQKNITLETQFIKGLPLVFADVSLIERVMQNLIDNALKFTASGGKIMILTSRYDHHIEVVVKDSGYGIQENQKDKIFDRHYKSNNQFKNLQNPGAGLGLTIAQKILELHQSTLRLSSKIKEGTSFSFSLPVYEI